MSLTQPKHFVMTIANAIASVNATDTFDTQIDSVGTNEIDFEGVTRNLDLKTPERTADEVKTFGATSGKQNSELDPQSPTKAEFTCTITQSPEADSEFDFYQFMLTAEGTKPTNYTRYNFASAAPSGGVAVVIRTNQGSGNTATNWLMNNASIELIGGPKSDADGNSTQDLRITCSADDCWVEFDADGGS